MDTIKFSLIIPIYNVENYIKRCLDSILYQTYTNYEIICINDGSTDNSFNILQQYKDHSNIKIINQENKGLGATRNEGVKYATGDYIWFIDSDDWISTDALLLLNNFILENKKYPIIIFDYNRIIDGKKLITKALNNYYRNDITSENYIKKLLLYSCPFMAQNKIFKKDIYEKSKFQFSNGFYEDIPLMCLYNRINGLYGYLDKQLYNYLIRDNSITKVFDRRVLDAYSQFDLVYQEIYSKDIYKKYITHFFYYISIITLDRINNSNDTKNLNKEFIEKFRIRKEKVKTPFSIATIKGITFKRFIKIICKNFYISYILK